jgi:hypothetical protein
MFCAPHDSALSYCGGQLWEGWHSEKLQERPVKASCVPEHYLPTATAALLSGGLQRWGILAKAVNIRRCERRPAGCGRRGPCGPHAG